MMPRRTCLRTFIVVSVALLASAGTTVAQEPQPIAFVGGTIIDGNGGPPLRDGMLVVVGKQIQAVGPRAQVTVPRGARVIEATGKFLIPGMIDTNVHLSLYGRGETLVRYQDRNADLTRESAQLHLKHGITTVRDSYGSLLALVQIRDEIARGETVGPRMLVAGNIVGWGGPCSISFSLIRESECTLLEEQFNDFIAQGSGEELMFMTPEEVRVAINKYLDLKPDFIKYGGTSHFSPAFIGFSPDVQRVIVEETHKRGLVAETHSTTIEGLRISVLAGIDLIQHPEALGMREMPDDLVKLIADRKVVCSMLTNTITGKVWKDHLSARARADSAAAKARADTTAEGRRERTSAELRRKEDEAGKGLEMRRLNAQKLIRGGCISTVGTDNYLGQAPEFRRTPKADNQNMGIGTIIGIEGLVELGMTPAEAIVAATKNGAIASRGLEKFGTLEAGKLADVVMLDADPLADISNIRKLAIVMKEGAIIDTDALPTKPVWHRR